MKKITKQQMSEMFATGLLSFPYVYKREVEKYNLSYFYNTLIITGKKTFEGLISEEVLQQLIVKDQSPIKNREYIVMPTFVDYVLQYYKDDSIPKEEKEKLSEKLLKMTAFSHQASEQYNVAELNKLLNELAAHVALNLNLSEKQYDLNENSFFQLVEEADSGKVNFTTKKYLNLCQILANNFENVEDLNTFIKKHATYSIKNSLPLYVWLEAAKKLVPEYSLEDLPKAYSLNDNYLPYLNKLDSKIYFEILKFYRFDLIKDLVTTLADGNCDLHVIESAKKILKDNDALEEKLPDLLVGEVSENLYKETLRLNFKYFRHQSSDNVNVATTLLKMFERHYINKDINVKFSYDNTENLALIVLVSPDQEYAKNFRQEAITLLKYIFSSEYLDKDRYKKLSRTNFGARVELEDNTSTMKDFSANAETFLNMYKLDKSLKSKDETKTKTKKI